MMTTTMMMIVMTTMMIVLMLMMMMTMMMMIVMILLMMIMTMMMMLTMLLLMMIKMIVMVMIIMTMIMMVMVIAMAMVMMMMLMLLLLLMMMLLMMITMMMVMIVETQTAQPYPTALHCSPFLHRLLSSSSRLNKSKIPARPHVAPSVSFGVHTLASRLRSGWRKQPSSSLVEPWHSESESQNVPAVQEVEKFVCAHIISCKLPQGTEEFGRFLLCKTVHIVTQWTILHSKMI